jgi:hypothetical protein
MQHAQSCQAMPGVMFHGHVYQSTSHSLGSWLQKFAIPFHAMPPKGHPLNGMFMAVLYDNVCGFHDRQMHCQHVPATTLNCTPNVT